MFLVFFGMQLSLVLAALRLITALDGEHGLRADPAAAGTLAAGCCAGAGYMVRACSQGRADAWPEYLVLAVYLTTCSLTDIQTAKVYDILQLPAAAAGALLCLTRPLPVERGMGVILFALLQYLLFRRMYGEGDVMAFQICSLYLTERGGDFQTLLAHMAAAFALLGLVQLFRRNINKRGDLKRAVPFLPYIACSLLCLLCFL